MPTLSHSQMETWSQCAEKWRLQKVERVPQAPASALILGDAVHQAIEAIGGALMLQEPAPSLLEVQQAFLDAFHERLMLDDPGECISKPEADVLVARGLAMLTAFREQVVPHYRPVAVEESFTVPVPLLDGWSFTGRVDARTHAVQADGSVIATIVDMKAIGKPWIEGAEHGKDQATAYLWAEEVAGKPRSGQVTFILLRSEAPKGWTVDKGPLEAKIEYRRTTRLGGQLMAYESKVQRVADAIQHEEFVPNPSPLCGWCPMLGACSHGRRWLTERGREPQPEIARFMALQKAQG